IYQRWADAQLNPVPPKLVETGVVHEEVHIGDTLLEHGGLEEFPVPISTPGFDNAPYLTAANWVTKDIDTGSINVGNYRAMVKSRTRLGIECGPPQHFNTHLEKCRARGVPLQAAIVMGAPPAVGYAGTAKLPYSLGEYDVAGGIAREPIELVKCKTVDLEVPATAEIVLEGELPTDMIEREAPFGEFTGFMGLEQWGAFFNVKCITHRKNPILNAFLSQFPPSESSKLRQVSTAGVLFKFLKYDCNIPSILGVGVHESGGSSKYVAIRMKKTHPSQVWQALNGASAIMPGVGKIIVAVDEDIDPNDPDSINWAMSFRMEPERDIRITPGKVAGLDPSGSPPGDPNQRYPLPGGSSGLLIDATRKWDYSPTSLPRKDIMERAKEIWEAEGLPALKPKVPWYGYPLGHWTKENAEEAELALKGDHFITGEKLEKMRKPFSEHKGH
ncbi:MAG: UbiD family decarboxylase, partial [Dehalococcoidia bacterium]|nr:UbiD family decarboxylase [Dehalococcoidia bacterium]